MLNNDEVLAGVEVLGGCLRDFVLERSVSIHRFGLDTCCIGRVVLTEDPDLDTRGVTFCGTGDEDLVTLCDSGLGCSCRYERLLDDD